MEPSAIEHAKKRLLKAQKSLDALKASRTFDQAEEAWVDFLLAISGIYSKLEQGSKGNGKASAWFGRKKKEQKDDPLLRYLRFARNSAEHGIERVVETTTKNFHPFNGQPLSFNDRHYLEVQSVDKETKQPNGPILQAVCSGPTLKPVRAKDSRFGDYCDPPKTHFGEHIKYHDFCDGLAEAALPYMEIFISEAESFSS